MTVSVTAYIALGSNLDDRERLIRSAIEQLERADDVQVMAVSDLIETDPVGAPGQGLYLNAAAELTTSLSPRELLDAMLRIEVAHGRDRRHEQARPGHWGPRTLDLDLLMYGTMVIDEPGLNVPHPRMHERDFVLRPLAQLSRRKPQGIVHPVIGLSIESLLLRLPDSRAQRQ